MLTKKIKQWIDRLMFSSSPVRKRPRTQIGLYALEELASLFNKAGKAPASQYAIDSLLNAVYYGDEAQVIAALCLVRAEARHSALESMRDAPTQEGGEGT